MDSVVNISQLKRRYIFGLFFIPFLSLALSFPFTRYIKPDPEWLILVITATFSLVLAFLLAAHFLKIAGRTQDSSKKEISKFIYGSILWGPFLLVAGSSVARTVAFAIYMVVVWR